MRLIDADILLKEGWVLHKMVGTTLHEMPLNHPDVPTVDVDSLNAAHEDIGYEKGFRDGYAEALDVTDSTKIIRHGHWIEEKSIGDCCYKCSKCGFIRDAYLLEIDNYCPWCGARMDIVVEDEVKE